MTDRVVRVVTADKSFRVLVARTTETVAGVLASQKARGEVARTLGDLVSGTILMREAMAADRRVQGLLFLGDGKSRLVADTWPDGATRGLVQIAQGATRVSFGDASRLHVLRSLYTGGLQQGVAAVRHDGSVASALTEYLRTSEQLVAFVALGTAMEGDTVRAAGGVYVQVNPDVERPSIEEMLRRVQAIEPLGARLAANDDLDDLLRALIGAEKPAQREESTVRFACQCNVERVVGSLATIARKDLEELVQQGDELEIACDYCGKEYRIHPDQLRGLLSEN